MTNGFALNHDKSLQLYFLCVKRQAKKRLSERCRKYSSTFVVVFGMTQPGIEPAASRSQSGRSTNWATVPVQKYSNAVL